MLKQLITSVNWTLGTAALLAALAGPFVIESFFAKAEKANAVNLVQAILKAERRYYDAQNKYYPFGRDEVDVTQQKLQITSANLLTSGYVFDAYYDEENRFVIRAVTDPDRLDTRPSALPSFAGVYVYRYIIEPRRGDVPEQGRSDWQRLGGGRQGLLSLFGF
jgi:hypothetical protein